jgi:hypothetical protein
MPESGLPKASQQIKTFQVGSLTIKFSKPTETSSDAKESIDSLEKAAQQKVFITYEQAE